MGRPGRWSNNHDASAPSPGVGFSFRHLARALLDAGARGAGSSGERATGSGIREPENLSFNPTPNSYGPVFRLNHLFGKYCGSGKGEYLVVVDPGEFTVRALDMPPNEENAAHTCGPRLAEAAVFFLQPPIHYPPGTART